MGRKAAHIKIKAIMLEFFIIIMAVGVLEKQIGTILSDNILTKV